MKNVPDYTFKLAWHTEEHIDLATIPHWILGTAAATISAIAAVGWSSRFSLRTLLINTTLVAVVLGLAVWAGQ